MKKLLSTVLSLFLLLYAVPAFAQQATATAVQPSIPVGERYGLLQNVQGGLLVAPVVPTNGTGAGAVVATTAVASALTLKGSAGTLADLTVTSGASAGFVMVFNATSAPADGAVTPALCYSIAANSTFQLINSDRMYFSTGVTVVFSTTGCFSKTASATAYMAGLAL